MEEAESTIEATFVGEAEYMFVVEADSELVGEADSAFVEAHSVVEKAAVEEYPVEEVDSAFEEAKIVV